MRQCPVTKSKFNFSNIFVEYVLTEEGIAMLEQIKGPLAVIKIAGRARTGKSTFINSLLLEKTKGFESSSKINACTKGIWIWNKVLPETYQGNPVNLLITDTCHFP